MVTCSLNIMFGKNMPLMNTFMFYTRELTIVTNKNILDPSRLHLDSC